MTLHPKIADRHLSRHACIYIRQSTLAQVRFNQESTDRQYNLVNKAHSLGWSQDQIRVLDRDLGKSGSAAGSRTDFKTLVGDVAMGHVGAIFSLEASRLARSNQDWHRLLELCAITGTLVIDEDGIYNPAEFNDGLVLGMKGTFAQAELHIIRARLHGGKLNKASRGDLRFVLPVGLVFDNDKIVLDPDREVQGAVRTVFDLFEREGTAYGVVSVTGSAKLTQGGKMNLTHPAKWFLRCGGTDAEGGGSDGVSGFAQAWREYPGAGADDGAIAEYGAALLARRRDSGTPQANREAG